MTLLDHGYEPVAAARPPIAGPTANADLLGPIAIASSAPPITRREKRFPWPIPNGWFAVTTTAELRPGDVKAVHYFNRDLVVFRTASGQARVVDAYCPHLGAHLGAGGLVEAETIRCPFHAWRFDGGTGACVDIPYQTDGPIPAKAKLRTYEVAERSGLVFAWHHLTGEPPNIQVPDAPEYSSEDWSRPITFEFFVNSACQEMAENNADYAHFKYVHGTESIPEGEEFFDGAYKRVESARVDGKGGGLFIRESFGLGLGLLHVGEMLVFTSSTTPIDESHLHVRWSFTAHRSVWEIQDMIIGQFLKGVSQDLPIWNNKIYHEPPVLVHGDGPIGKFRKWAAQFYSWPAEARP